jgi:Sec-independent protein translocase protein TatA
MPDLLVVLIVILVAVIFWRGPKNLPKLGEALGRGIREARREVTDSASARTKTEPGAGSPAADASSEAAVGRAQSTLGDDRSGR